MKTRDPNATDWLWAIVCAVIGTIAAMIGALVAVSDAVGVDGVGVVPYTIPGILIVALGISIRKRRPKLTDYAVWLVIAAAALTAAACAAFELAHALNR